MKKKLPILPFGDPALRLAAKPVAVFNRKLQAFIDALANTLKSRKDGAALAATQVGVLKRVIVIDYEKEYLELVNPEIFLADGEQTDWEGCLSFPGYTGRVRRHARLQLKYQDRHGETWTIEREGLLARCIQHEVDHLNGVLFIDRMQDDYLVHEPTQTRLELGQVLDLSYGRLPAGGFR